MFKATELQVCVSRLVMPAVQVVNESKEVVDDAIYPCLKGKLSICFKLYYCKLLYYPF